MPAYFIESSALVKRFASERGTKFIQSLMRPAAKNRLYAARITEIEVCSALVRRQKGRSLSADQTAKALRRLHRNFPVNLTNISISENVVVEAIRVAETYGLRGYDAVQMAAALIANRARGRQGLPPIIFISADSELNVAAVIEGLSVENPNDYP